MTKIYKVTQKQYGLINEYYLKHDKNSLLIKHHIGNPIENDLRKYYDHQLTEGYYKTYPIKNVAKYIQTLIGDNGKVNVDLDSGSKPNINVLTYNKNTIFLNQLNKGFELCGYYKSGEWEVKGYHGLVSIQYEPRYPDDLDNEVREVGFLYHVTPKKNLQKILKNGLVPYSKNNTFKYPNRIYMIMGYATKEHIVNVVNTLSQGTTNLTYNDISFFNEEWCIIKINVDKLNDNTKFYADTNMFDGYAIFTYDNIPPSALSLVGIVPT